MLTLTETRMPPRHDLANLTTDQKLEIRRASGLYINNGPLSSSANTLIYKGLMFEGQDKRQNMVVQRFNGTQEGAPPPPQENWWVTDEYLQVLHCIAPIENLLEVAGDLYWAALGRMNLPKPKPTPPPPVILAPENAVQDAGDDDTALLDELAELCEPRGFDYCLLRYSKKVKRTTYSGKYVVKILQHTTRQFLHQDRREALKAAIAFVKKCPTF